MNKGEQMMDESDENNHEMRTNQIIHSLFQDQFLKIPFFYSHTPTKILAIQIKNQYFNPTYALNRILKVINDYKQKNASHSGIISYQIKLYYMYTQPIRTILIQFESIEQATQFKQKYSIKQQELLQQHSQTAATNSNNQIDKDWKFQKYHILYEQKYEEQLYQQLNIVYCKQIQEVSQLQRILFQYGLICVQYPQSEQLLACIKKVAQFIVVEGIRAEQQLYHIMQSSEFEGVDLNFLNSKNISSQYMFYKWRVYSYLQGDGDHTYRMQPFQIVEGGPVWHPPHEKVMEKYGQYSKMLKWKERIYFGEAILKKLTCNKFHIQQAMTFCIYHISSAFEISSIIAQKFTETCSQLSSSSPPSSSSAQKQTQKSLLAILYLISDILFHSPTFIYRQIFTTIIPDLLFFYFSASSKTQELNKKIIQVFECWEKKFVLEPQFCEGLKYLLKNSSEILYNGDNLLKNTMSTNKYEEIEWKSFQNLCQKYGISRNMDQNVGKQIIEILISDEKIKNLNKNTPPELSSTYDGEPLTEKDYQKIKSKTYKVVTCNGIPTKSLFETSSSMNKQ